MSANTNSEKNKIISTLSNENYRNEDSVEFFELLISIWKGKSIIILVTIIITILSYIYAHQLDNIYKVEVYLQSPYINDASDHILVDTARHNIYKTGAFRSLFEDIFKEFRKNLESRKMQRTFLIETGLFEKLKPKPYDMSMDKQIFENFFSLIKINSKNEYSLSISNESNEPNFYAKILNDFVEFVNDKTVQIQTDHAKKRIEQEIDDLKTTISSKRKMAKIRREDQIVRFEEAVIIAESLGFERRVDAKNIIQSTSKLASDITSATTPLYYIGTEALAAEISILENRLSDDPFIQGLRDLQENLAYLETLKIERNLKAITVDQYAYAPKNHIYPDRVRIISIAIFLGFMFGLIIVVLFTFIKNQFKIFNERK